MSLRASVTDHDPVAAAVAKSWYEKYLSPKTWPFWGFHIAAVIGVALVGFSWTGLLLAACVYVAQMFFVTGVYHRYFSHRTYKTSRWFQFVLGFLAETTAQKGVLWWSAHHRVHHKHSDHAGDPHASKYGFWWSHVGWINSRDFEETDYSKVKDMAKYPELVWLNKHWYVPIVALGVTMFLIGGAWALTWGFLVAITACWHGTFTINSLTHRIGTRRYQTTDESRNHWFLALITLGEGWHNNHHHYQTACRQGHRWWEYDVTYYIIRGLAAVGLVWDVKEVPSHILANTIDSARRAAGASDPALPMAVEPETKVA